MESNLIDDPHNLQNRNGSRCCLIFLILFLKVPPSGIEPPSSESESEILSIKLQRRLLGKNRQKSGVFRIIKKKSTFKYKGISILRHLQNRNGSRCCLKFYPLNYKGDY
jgi:hypothetical protein